MTIAAKLANVFARAAREKKAEAAANPRYFSREDIPGITTDDLDALRRDFEESMSDEEILRQKAKEYARLARSRALDQGSAAGDFFKRLTPVPYTGGEAAWRVPAIAAGAYAGWRGLPHLTGDNATPANVEEVARVLQATPIRDQAGVLVDRTIPMMEQIVEQNLQRPGPIGGPIAHADLEHVTDLLTRSSTGDVAQVVGRGRKLGPEAQHILSQLPAGIERRNLQEAYLRAAVGGGRGREAASLFQPGRPWMKWLGGASGLAGASILTGLPMAIRAGALRRSGGEMSHQARKRMRKAIEHAEREQFRRENILRSMRGETPLPLSEWKAQKKQLRSDWRESSKEYRGAIRERRKAERGRGSDEGEEG